MTAGAVEPITVEGAEIRRVRLPLRAPWVSVHGSILSRALLLVRLATDGADGWGECSAFEVPDYSAEYTDGALDALRRFLLPALARRARIGPIHAADVLPALTGVAGHPMAKAALEMAVLDAQLRTAGRPFAEHLGAIRRRVPAGVSVGITRPLGALVDAVAGFVEQGYTRVKIKIEPGWDTEPVAALRRHFGDGLLLQADANGSYAGGDTTALAVLDRHGLLLVEQPLAADDLPGHAALARRLATPVCLDESITSLAATVAALDLGACGVVNLKPARVGGYLEAVRIHDLCRERAVPLWLGGMVESGVARTANAALAALSGFTLPGDLSGSDRFFERDLTRPVLVDDGHIAVPTGPGASGTPLTDALEGFTESSAWVPLT